MWIYNRFRYRRCLWSGLPRQELRRQCRLCGFVQLAAAAGWEGCRATIALGAAARPAAAVAVDLAAFRAASHMHCGRGMQTDVYVSCMPAGCQVRVARGNNEDVGHGPVCAAAAQPTAAPWGGGRQACSLGGKAYCSLGKRHPPRHGTGRAGALCALVSPWRRRLCAQGRVG